jgi:hypothetical protein
MVRGSVGVGEGDRLSRIPWSRAVRLEEVGPAAVHFDLRLRSRPTARGPVPQVSADQLNRGLSFWLFEHKTKDFYRLSNRLARNTVAAMRAARTGRHENNEFERIFFVSLLHVVT